MAAKTTPKRVSKKDMDLRILELRKSGASLEQIAAQFNVAPSLISKDLIRILKEHTKMSAEHIDGVRTLELERLDQLLLGVWADATSGDVKAINAALRIMERRAALMGLDSATLETLNSAPRYQWTLNLTDDSPSQTTTFDG